jgi:hypothetical protein
MAQKRTDYSKFTQPNGTIQVLMLWASVALHLAIGSNLGLFGRLDPIKVKPAGGTVRVVDLTPAEQTRVPESAKSRPLPIAQTPINPEPATRNPITFNAPSRSGTSIFTPPKVNRPQLPPPSSQVPNTPTPPSTSIPPVQPQSPSNNNKNNSLTVPKPKPPRATQSGADVSSSQGNNNGDGEENKKTKKPSESDISENDSTINQNSNQQNRRRVDNLNKNDRNTRSTPPTSPPPISEQKQKTQDAIAAFRNSGNNLITVEIPASLQKKSSSCSEYKDIDMSWPIDEKGNRDLSTDGTYSYTRENIFPDDKLSGKLRERAKTIVQTAHEGMSSSQRQKLISQYKKGIPNFAYYSFKIPTC